MILLFMNLLEKENKKSKRDSLFQLFSTGHKDPVLLYLNVEKVKNKQVSDSLIWSFSKQKVPLQVRTNSMKRTKTANKTMKLLKLKYLLN